MDSLELKKKNVAFFSSDKKKQQLGSKIFSHFDTRRSSQLVPASQPRAGEIHKVWFGGAAKFRDLECQGQTLGAPGWETARLGETPDGPVIIFLRVGHSETVTSLS